ncbi:PIG-L family deacetylase [Streptomyces sp. WAC05374]|uniref:PIG-L family deacetylase n=1 Tax=Streptomyces sp. WAC05374 TaxID=2487420 RepID=UPI000F89271D|nr:PIG-L family deacetylase [Streptomyces sp. WAC05374]RST11111.1 PIG-L family deacetylase [Streptomyces sp. WAC05374]TDF37137.1 PIG-L family deacetylase [Streptomyces sp. WAC05374]TDF44929.1 PIG-L family deacetylase [Streptomyces sp. WAC05374]TDF45788.1 PIG-L family deacetylase [Streptomyces sp. WAC05374]
MAVAGLAGCSVPAPRRTGPTADPAPGMPISSSGRAQLMQIAAHPDDDLYFMNPDSQRMIDAGVPLVSVYVTAGEHDGRNHIPGRRDVPADKAAYSSARHQGLRQAYATMLGLDAFTPWQKGVMTLRGDRRAEINTLTHGNRRVELVFLNLAMHAPRRWMALPSLWKDRALGLRTVVADDSPVRRADTYDYDALVDVLVGLMERYRPTVIHTLDPDPDIQHSDERTRKKDSEQPGYSDHADHTAVASFSWAAMVRWVADATTDGGAIPAFVTTSFRGYYNRHWPKNLPGPVLAEKAAHLVPYGGDPSWDCGNSGGCGDYNVGGVRPLTNKKGWVRATHHRHPSPGPFVAAEPDGRLAVYGVLGLRAVRWRETAPGSGQWGEPGDLGGGPLAPGLGGVTLEDGRHLLFGLRFAAIGGHGGPNRREVVLLEQRQAGGPFLAWTGLGNPEHGDDRGRRLGVPVAVAAPDGRVHLFVRNADKGVSGRVREADGSWGPWRDLGGAEVQDGLSAAVDATGRVHLFAAGRDTVHHWAQDAPGGPVAFRAGTALPVAGDPVAVTATPDAGPVLLYRAPARAELTAVRLDGTPLPGVPLDGYGRVAAAATPAGPVLLGTDLRGRLVVRTPEGRQVTRTQGAVPWGPAVLHVSRERGTLALGMGADARPWSWAPEPRTEG